MDHYSYGYDEGYYAGRQQAKVDKAVGKAFDGGSSLLGIVLFLLLTAFYFLMIFSGVLLLSIWLLHTFKIGAGQPFKYQVLIVLAMAYGLLCIIFLLKGMLVSFRQHGNGIWRLIWMICTAAICVLPIMFIQTLVAGWIHGEDLKLLAWIPALLIGWFIYKNYRLTQDTAPKFLKWVYRIGRNIA